MVGSHKVLGDRDLAICTVYSVISVTTMRRCIAWCLSAYRTKLETDLMRELNAPMLASGPTRPNWPSPYSHTSLVDVNGSYSLFTLLKSSTSEKITLLHVSKCFLMWFIMLLVVVLAGLSLIYFIEKMHAFI